MLRKLLVVNKDKFHLEVFVDFEAVLDLVKSESATCYVLHLLGMDSLRRVKK